MKSHGLLEDVQSERLQTNWSGSLRLAVGTQPTPYGQAYIVSLLLDLNQQLRILFTGKGTKLLTDQVRLVGRAQVVHIVKVDRGGVLHQRLLGIESAERPADSDG